MKAIVLHTEFVSGKLNTQRKEIEVSGEQEAVKKLSDMADLLKEEGCDVWADGLLFYRKEGSDRVNGDYDGTIGVIRVQG